MHILTGGLIVLVAGLHIWFLVLEMFLWQKPLGLKTFRLSPAQAKATAVLAANQGLYNGFLAAGLLYGLIAASLPFQIFFLTCVVIAGLYGGYSVNRRIILIQSLPALIALIFVLVPLL